MRRLAALLLLAACAQPPPPVRQVGVTDGREPEVRVHLASLGDWTELEVTGKGGLRATTGDDDVALEGAYRLARTGPPVRLRPLEGVFTVGGHAYAGDLEWRGGRLVHRVALENYVLGVLRGELPLKTVPVAAAAAQAIAARSYALHYLSLDRPHFDLDDTTQYQRYVGLAYAPDDGNLRAGVRQTTGLYLSDGGAPLKTYYHSTCGGHTTDVPTGLDRDDLSPMRGVPCAWCKDTRYWRWEATVPEDEVLRAAALAGPLEGLEVAARGAGERPRAFAVRAGGVTKTIHANRFRLAVGPSLLRSTNVLRVERTPAGLRVEGGGWGHGVGLCQLGAIGMAREGRPGEEIAAYYYPGATIRRAY